MPKTITAVSPKSTAKTCVVLGVVLGVLSTVAQLIIAAITSLFSEINIMGEVFSFSAFLYFLGDIIGLTIFGALFGYLCALAYNRMAPKIGGLEIELK